MLKRLVAILFIFVIAGQVSAGVCGCLAGQAQKQHSCCKRKKLPVDSMRPTNCCDGECMVRQSERLPQDRTQASANITFNAVADRVPLALPAFQPVRFVNAVRSSTDDGHRLKHARPPELYLRHHAFLI